MKNQTEIANELELTHQRVQQIENTIIKFIRKEVNKNLLIAN
jgi:DNA-directed RNA polymerase specialized sigma subunit